MTAIQQVILDIYKAVAGICRRNKIPFFAIGGTCIGAIRHNGFIPWDDDLDIAVPIEHWDNLILRLEEELPKHLYLYTSDNKLPYHFPYMKVCNKNTTFIERSEYNNESAYKGIFVDIMPISGVPLQNKDKFVEKLRVLHRNNEYLRFPEMFLNGWRPAYLKMLYWCAKKALPFNYFSKKYLAELKKYPFKCAKQTGYVWSLRLNKLIFPIEYFKSTLNKKFEDTEIPVPVGYHEYLTMQFGNYMKIPPLNEQATHAGLIDTQRPYKYYFGKKLS